MFRTIVFGAAVMALAVCVAPTAMAKRIDSHEVSFGSLKIYWRDFLAISALHKKSFPQPKGQSVYMFGQVGDKKVPFRRFVELAEQAVRHEGKCEWLGYDQKFDHAFRAAGLASRSDTRLFFVKLRCK